MGLVYLPTFTIHFSQMWVNVPYDGCYGIETFSFSELAKDIDVDGTPVLPNQVGHVLRSFGVAGMMGTH